MTTETPILAYRWDNPHDPQADSWWYCPACWAEAVAEDASVTATPIIDADDLPRYDDSQWGMTYQCEADCGRYLHTGKTLAEMAG